MPKRVRYLPPEDTSGKGAAPHPKAKEAPSAPTRRRRGRTSPDGETPAEPAPAPQPEEAPPAPTRRRGRATLGAEPPAPEPPAPTRRRSRSSFDTGAAAKAPAPKPAPAPRPEEAPPAPTRRRRRSFLAGEEAQEAPAAEAPTPEPPPAAAPARARRRSPFGRATLAPEAEPEAEPEPEAPAPEPAPQQPAHAAKAAAPEPAAAEAPVERETPRQTNEKLIRALFSARQEDDQQALRRLLADDVTLYLPGEDPSVGRDSVFAAWDRQAELLDEALAFEADLRDLAASDDHVFTYVETRAEAPGAGRGVNYTTMTVYRIRGGQVVEVRQHVDDVTAYAAFWSALAPGSGNREAQQAEPDVQQAEPEVREPEPAPPPRKKGFARFR